MNPFPGALRYLRIFRGHVGRRLFVVFVLSFVAALSEGIRYRVAPATPRLLG